MKGYGVLSRGERNHNPGNIDRTGTAWLGMACEQTDQRFVTFESPFYGIRALAKVLLAYYNVHGLRTLRELVHRWAPPVENDTEAYVQHAASVVGLDADLPINLHAEEVLVKLVEAVIHHENGRVVYERPVIVQSVRAALGKSHVV